MPITYRPTQSTEIAARTGTAIGAAEKAKTEQRINLQLEAEERAKAWEITKMELESQRRFANWQREQQAKDEAFLRAKEWEIEKAELASRMDFQRREEERQRKLSELDAQEKALKEAKEKFVDNPAIQQKEFELWRQRLAITTGVTPGHYRPTQQEQPDVIDQLIAQSLGQEGPSTPASPTINQQSQNLPSIPPGRIAMKSPDGTVGTVLPDEVKTYQDQGYVLLPGQNVPVEEPTRRAGTANFSWANRSMRDLLR